MRNNKLIVHFSWICIGFLSLLGNGCKTTNATSHSTAQMLVDSGYLVFFPEWDVDNLGEKLLSDRNFISQLNRIIRDRTASDEARFIAAELLVQYNPVEVSWLKKYDLASVYVRAFQENYTGKMIRWGFYPRLETKSFLYERMLLLKKEATPLMLALLSDKREAKLHIYERPDDITKYHLRVNDLAALYLAGMYSTPVEFTTDSKQRDAEIQRLHTFIQTEGAK